MIVWLELVQISNECRRIMLQSSYTSPSLSFFDRNRARSAGFEMLESVVESIFLERKVKEQSVTCMNSARLLGDYGMAASCGVY